MATGASCSVQGSKIRKQVVLSIKEIVELLDKCGLGVVNGTNREFQLSELFTYLNP